MRTTTKKNSVRTPPRSGSHRKQRRSMDEECVESEVLVAERKNKCGRMVRMQEAKEEVEWKLWQVEEASINS